ncbi:MAG: type I-E CRISPR-associated protein Cse1/CasA [Aquabacterium sp.]
MAFNLLDEPWVPVRFNDGLVREIGLLELFDRASDIIGLAETSPPNLVAIYRVLLAITNRALTTELGPWKDADRARWYQQGLPLDAIKAYLTQWRDRFWVFHPSHPFMQVAALNEIEETKDKTKPWTQIALDSASGNTPVVFDHAVDTVPIAIPVALALRQLLGYMQFTPGGLVKAIRDSDKAGALANTAAVIPVGHNLNQTLCLCLHGAAPATDDLPAWELAAPQIKDLMAEGHLASGLNDRYTRLSRAVLFLPEDGQTHVQTIRFAAGLALTDDPNATDSMASYRMGAANMVRVTFTEGRALWRDLPAMLPDASGKAALPAPVLSWATNLYNALGQFDATLHLIVVGIASEKAKLLRWRVVTVSLPQRLAENEGTAQALRQQIQHAEDVYSQVRKVVSELFAKMSPDSASKDTYARARATVESGPLAPSYYAALERALPALMTQLASGDEQHAHEQWSTAIRDAAEQAWQASVRTAGQSAAALRAQAMTYPKFKRILKQEVLA